MIIDLLAVMLDGTTPTTGDPRKQKRQPIEWPRGFAGTIRLACVNEAGAVVDLAALTVRLTVRRARSSEQPVLALAATGNLIEISAAHSDQDLGRCLYDVTLTDAAPTSKRWQIVPTAPWLFTDSASQPDDTLTP